MGLNRIVMLGFKGFDHSKDHQEFLSELAEVANEMYDAGFSEGDFNEITQEVNWYGILDDMKELSVFFPDIVLMVTVMEGDGEQWTSYFWDGEMANELTYPVFYEFDKTDWNDIEVVPVWCRNNGSCKTCDEGKESFWSVYLRKTIGEVVCIADFPTKKEALAFEQLIWNVS